MDDITQAATEAVKVAPPATVAALTFFGYPVADDVQAIMLVYAIALVAQQGWKLFRWIKRRGWEAA